MLTIWFLRTISVKFPWVSTDGQDPSWRRNIAENFNRLSTAHERYSQTTDGRHNTDVTKDGWAIAYSDRERQFKFAKMNNMLLRLHELKRRDTIWYLG